MDAADLNSVGLLAKVESGQDLREVVTLDPPTQAVSSPPPPMRGAGTTVRVVPMVGRAAPTAPTVDRAGAGGVRGGVGGSSVAVGLSINNQS